MSTAKIRVLVVDDAVVIRRMLSEVLGQDPEIEVVGTAANGRIALQKLELTPTDIVTLDVEMPEMDGVQTLRELRRKHPKLPVIMFSTITQRGASTTMEALAAGASDYVTKPGNMTSPDEAIRRMQADLVPKVKALCRRSGFVATAPPARPITGGTVGAATPVRPPITQLVEVVALGTSTGGPNALATVFRGFTEPCPVPIVMVQHMPPLFTKMLAERLNALKSPLVFHEAVDGQPVEAGHAYLAPGGRHMEVVRRTQGMFIQLHDGLPENSCRPAVDVLFRSVAAAYKGRTLAVILTGMGQDGLLGCQGLRSLGAQVLVQDEASSVVWGMPGQVAQAGLADRVLPLSEVAGEIQRRVGRAPAGPGAWARAQRPPAGKPGIVS